MKQVCKILVGLTGIIIALGTIFICIGKNKARIKLLINKNKQKNSYYKPKYVTINLKEYDEKMRQQEENKDII